MEAELDIYQLAAPLSTVPTTSYGVKTTTPSVTTPTFKPSGTVDMSRYNRVTLNQSQLRQADRLARQQARKNQPSYFERNGERRFDTIVNGLKDLISTGISGYGLVQAIQGKGGYITDENGNKQYLTQEDYNAVRDYSNSMASQAQSNGMDFMQMMMMMNMMNQKNNRNDNDDDDKSKKGNNTILYVGLGVAAVALLGFVMMSNKK